MTSMMIASPRDIFKIPSRVRSVTGPSVPGSDTPRSIAAKKVVGSTIVSTL